MECLACNELGAHPIMENIGCYNHVYTSILSGAHKEKMSSFRWVIFCHQEDLNDKTGSFKSFKMSHLKCFLSGSVPFRQGLNWSKNNCCNEQRQSAADGGRLQRGCSSRQGGTFIIPKMSTGDWDGQHSWLCCDFLCADTLLSCSQGWELDMYSRIVLRRT